MPACSTTVVGCWGGGANLKFWSLSQNFNGRPPLGEKFWICYGKRAVVSCVIYSILSSVFHPFITLTCFEFSRACAFRNAAIDLILPARRRGVVVDAHIFIGHRIFNTHKMIFIVGLEPHFHYHSIMTSF